MPRQSNRSQTQFIWSASWPPHSLDEKTEAQSSPRNVQSHTAIPATRVEPALPGGESERLQGEKVGEHLLPATLCLALQALHIPRSTLPTSYSHHEAGLRNGGSERSTNLQKVILLGIGN